MPFFLPLRPLLGLLALHLVLAPAPVGALPLTRDRLEHLPDLEKNAWQDYLRRSTALALADQSALQAELQSLGLTLAIRAPSGGDFKLPEKADPAWFASEEAARLADVVLSYQTPGGGWSKHTGYSAGPRKPGMQWTSQNEPGASAHYLATFDNRSTTEQLHFLAGVWRATKRQDCQAAILRGLQYVLDAQYPNGGWPQVYPLEGGYHDDITFNDNAMTNVLELLHAVSNDEPEFAFVDPDFRQRCAASLAAGLRCVLATQLAPDGRKAGWCAQYDALTLAPSSARKMEPATLSGLESARMLKFLMTLPSPSPELVASIEGALDWFDRAKITTISKATVDGKTVYQVNPASTEVYWARFYDLSTGRPVFPGRDGVVYETYEAMIAKNRGGYDYFTTQPGSIVTNGQKKWRKMLAATAGR